MADIASLGHLAWFPDGRHLLLNGATEGQPLRTYEMDLEGGKTQPLDPPILPGAPSPRMESGSRGGLLLREAVVLDRETQKMQVIPGIGPRDQFEKWTEDGQALLVSSATPWEARMYRVEVATGSSCLATRDRKATEE